MEIVSQQLRKKILERDSYVCAYCGLTYSSDFLHIDHIQPRSKGGSNYPSNLITACKTCNEKKHTKILLAPPLPREIELEDGDLIVDDKIRYPMFSCRLSEEVQEQLKAAKLNSELSWNKFFKSLLEEKYRL